MEEENPLKLQAKPLLRLRYPFKGNENGFLPEYECANNEQPFTWAGLEKILNTKTPCNSFVKFVEERIAARNDITYNTRKNHKVFYSALKEFGVIQTFSDITKQNIIKFDEWLRSRKTYTQSTIAGYHKFMKVFINEAIRLEHLNHSPYDTFKVDRGKSKMRRFLRTEELQMIENAELPNDSLKKVRDVFLFQCYTGMAYVDLKKFDFSKVER